MSAAESAVGGWSKNDFWVEHAMFLSASHCHGYHCCSHDLDIPINVIFLQCAVFVFVNVASKCPVTSPTPEQAIKEREPL